MSVWQRFLAVFVTMKNDVEILFGRAIFIEDCLNISSISGHHTIGNVFYASEVQ